MVILKCKMCGGDIEANADKTFGTCDSCGSTMTLPKIDDDRRANIFNRANHFRRLNDFDKAIGAYERILSEDDTDAEAHWGVVLSRYGIEYVEDPKTRARIPTCHRVQTDSILADADYLAALQYAPDGYTRSLYEQEAKRIAEIQKGILAISSREEPYDVFICYKETTTGGARTRDSAIAQDVYYQLTNEGYKVFFSRITLEDKLGQAYEPYIFAALNSARVMVVIGTKAEHFNAVWVKNEWSRYLNLMKRDRGRLLIPCYRDMDPYDLPEALSMLQSQDMAKIGFIQDLIRGVKKVLDAGRASEQAREAVPGQSGGGNIDALMKRGWLSLEDGDWEVADGFFEQALMVDPEHAYAYVGKLCAELHAPTRQALANCEEPIIGCKHYKKALRFGDDALKEELMAYNHAVIERNNEKHLAALYEDACARMNRAIIAADYHAAAARFQAIRGYRDADALATECKRQGDAIAEAFAEKRRQNEAAIRDARNALIELQQTYEARMRRYQARRSALGVFDNREKRIVDDKIAALQKKYQELTQILNAEYVTALIAADDRYGAAQVAILQEHNVEKARAIFDFSRVISAGGWHAACVLHTRTVAAAGDNGNGQCNVRGWRDIVAVSAGYNHTVGLQSDGTVVAVGENNFGQCNVQDWRNIVAVSAGHNHTVGLQSDGTVVAAGSEGPEKCGVRGWRDIVAVSAGHNHTVGLQSDGAVVAVGDNNFGQCNVQGWRDIVTIAAGDDHTVGLKADGALVAVGKNNTGQCNVGVIRDAMTVAAGSFTAGLSPSGVSTIGRTSFFKTLGWLEWRNILAISVGSGYLIGLQTDGTVVTAWGSHINGLRDVEGWKLW